MERPRRRKVALVMELAGEVVEAERGAGMLGAQHLLPDRRRARSNSGRAAWVALVMEQEGEAV
jgi:hypothetical protein